MASRTVKIPVVLRQKSGRGRRPDIRPRGRPPVYFYVAKYGLFLALICTVTAQSMVLVVGLRQAEHFGASNERESNFDSDAKWFSFPSQDELRFGAKTSDDDNVFTKFLNVPFWFNYEQRNEDTIDDQVRLARNAIVASQIIGIMTTLVIFISALFDLFCIVLISSTLLAIYSISLLFKITTIYEVVCTLIAVFFAIYYLIALKFAKNVYTPVVVK